MNPSTALAAVLVDALVRLGLRHLVLAPGSRSAPLAYAAAAAAEAGRLQLHVRVDERSAGFLALGLARGAGSPARAELAAVVTTSGTAAANLHPAVLEAHHAGVPLIVLTADRPHELRGSGASQTADAQARLFLPSVRFSADVPAPVDPDRQAPSWRSSVSRAVAAARGRTGRAPGPVHLDVAFADPLTPGSTLRSLEPDPEIEELSAHPRLAGRDPAGLTRVAPAAPATPVVLPRGPRTLVLAGDCPDPAVGAAARALAEQAGWPLLAEPSSGARGGENTVGAYRVLLESDDSEGPLGKAVDRVVLFGHPTLSRPVSRLLARDDVEVVVVSGGGAWSDAGFRASAVLPAATVDAPALPAERRWARRWKQAAERTEAALAGLLDGPGALSGAAVARAVVQACAADGAALMVAASNAVRDVDLAGSPSADVAVVANRGLAGIDGTLASGFGVALARRGPVRILVGDLAFLHDANALLIGPVEERPDVTIVLVNDDGGGIFETLEHATAVPREVFERVVATPHGADVGALCAAFGVPHSCVTSREELRERLAARPRGIRVLEVPLDRRAVAGHVEALAREVRAAVAAEDAAAGDTGASRS
ncbi:2-succinyl-5-enolpyruvyl-6-hydroxy-3-cyclohexene-1-carboxylic-acid synthase [Kineococcus gynurae]|uniref:2-succinyl-5-enolpyruvyl-6-hydroxy-3-cyclohexene-1-carboxylate synthase n=1 Tax=Kineococcus gynurae TaxID=452979 RepID=A0ABV5LTK7_9ACTN